MEWFELQPQKKVYLMPHHRALWFSKSKSRRYYNKRDMYKKSSKEGRLNFNILHLINKLEVDPS